MAEKRRARSRRSPGSQAGWPPVSWFAERFSYEPDAGHIFGPSGQPVGASGPGGALLVWFTDQGKRQSVLAHRLALALESGEWPAGQIAHRNGDKADNRRANLVQTAHRGRMAGPFSVGCVDIGGVRQYRVGVRVDGRRVFRGFKFEQEAAAYAEACKAAAAAGGPLPDARAFRTGQRERPGPKRRPRAA